MNAEHYSILSHTVHRAAGGYYCGGGEAMIFLVEQGLMRSAGFKPFVEDEYFTITRAGREALAAWEKEQPKPKVRRPRQSPAFAAWRDYGSHVSFPHFLRTTWKNLNA